MISRGFESFKASLKNKVLPVRAFLLILFFISGICGLVYEVVWSRMLTLVMGNTVFATSTVLAAFMLGLALGSWLLGRVVDRYGRPLVLYAAMECLLGLYCFLLPILMEGVLPIYQFFYRSFGGSSSLLTMTQFLLSGLLIVIPASLMGGTLPVLTKYFIKGVGEIGSTAAKLYAINTIGAVVGAIAAGFIFIPDFGVRATLYGAAIVNVGVGVLTFGMILIRSEVKAPQVTSRFLFRSGDQSPSGGALVLMVFSFSGASALIYEVAWTRCLSILLGPSIHAFSLMLGAFIAGLALGSWLISFVVDRTEKLLPLMATMQWCTAIVTLILIPFINDLPGWIRDVLRTTNGSFTQIQLINAVIVFIILMIPATCLGSVFPIAVKQYSRSMASFGRRMGNLYAGNTVGAVLGSVMAGFLLIPSLGFQKTIFVAVLINGILAAILLWVSGFNRAGVKAGFTLGSLLIIIVIIGFTPAWQQQNLSSGPYKYFYRNEAMAQRDLRELELLYYREGVTGTVAVKRRGNRKMLMISGKVDASSGPVDMVTQVLIGHIPLLMAKDPKDVLVIGLASGVTLGAVAQHPVEKIDCLEISYEVKEAARFFNDINHDVLSDDRVNLIIQDGRNHLLLSDQQYDVIISEPSNPWMAGIANLYTQEFFETARKRLRPNGVMGQWIEAYHIPNHLLKSIVRTYAEVFPYVSLWVTDVNDPGDILLLGSAYPIRTDVKELKRRLAVSNVRSDLFRYNSHLWWQVMQRAISGGRILKESVIGEPFHTDDRPFLEFELPKTFHKVTWPENGEWLSSMINRGSQRYFTQQFINLSQEDQILLSAAQWAIAAEYKVMGREGI